MTQAPPPEVNYFGLLGLIDPKLQERCLEEGAEAHQELFALELETMEKAAGLQELGAQDRLNAYQQRSAQQWAALQQQRPDLYKNDFADFEKLVHTAFAKNAAKAVTQSLRYGVPYAAPAGG